MRPTTTSIHVARRRGLSLMETSVAIFIVAVAATMVAQLVRTSAQQRHAVDRRLIASQEAANVLEQLRRRPWEELTKETVEQFKLSDLAARALSDGQLSVLVTDEIEPRSGRRIDARVTWSSDGGVTTHSAELTTWRFAP